MIVMEVGIVKDGLFLFWFRYSYAYDHDHHTEAGSCPKIADFFRRGLNTTFPKVSPFHNSQLLSSSSARTLSLICSTFEALRPSFNAVPFGASASAW